MKLDINVVSSCYTIIVTYNATRNNWLQKCLDSLLKSTLKTEIIIVDNLSTDETVKVIKLKYPSVHLIENKENKGFGGANNQGLKYALESGGEYFFLLNQDAWVEPNTIEKLVYQLKGNPEYGIVSPLHLNGEGSALDYNFSNYIKPDRCPLLYSDFVINSVKDAIYESQFVCAAAWMISRNCLKKVGGFNPSFFHYGEDVNYVHRLMYKGLKIGVLPSTFVYHDREHRETSMFFDKRNTQKRKLLLEYSNPNENVAHKKRIKQCKYQIIKNYLFLNFKEAQEVKRYKNLLIETNRKSKKNLLKSKSDLLFQFILDNNYR